MITDLILGDGIQIKRVTMTNGGEWAGTCPWCGGKDRFRVWPIQDRYWCRQCRHSGDSIQYIRDFHNLSFSDACSSLGRKAWGCYGYSMQINNPKWKTKGAHPPSEVWQKKAGLFINWTINQLWSDTGSATLEWLGSVRGLSYKTIKDAAFGWCPKDYFRERASWGLDEILKDNGNVKKLWLPKGLIIPYQINSMPIRIRIRRPEPGDGPRYYIVPGSNTKPMILRNDNPVIIITESEIDTILIHQEAGDIVTSFALGNAQARPDEDTHRFLSEAGMILVALDADGAGAKETWNWWMNQYPQARRWPPVEGKDPGDMYKNGIDVRKWIEAGLNQYLRACI